MLKLAELMKSYDYFFFDLDETIWRTLSKHAHQIFAKQMLPPFKMKTTSGKRCPECESWIDYEGFPYIEDDVGNTNFLFSGVKEVLQTLHDNKKSVNIISLGGIKNINLMNQPSYKLLDEWGIKRTRTTILYKTDSKKKKLAEFEHPFVLFDDDIKQLQEVSELPNAKCINVYSFDDWKDLL